MGNTFKTAFLLTALTLLLMFFGRYFWRPERHDPGAGFCRRHELRLVFLFRQDRAGHVSRASRSAAKNLPRAYAAVERLTQKIGIPMPKMYVIPTESPNAFATGRNPSHASVAVTHGILQSAHRRRTGRRAGPRTRPRQQPRHPDQFGRGHPCRRNHLCSPAWDAGP